MSTTYTTLRADPEKVIHAAIIVDRISHTTITVDPANVTYGALRATPREPHP